MPRALRSPSLQTRTARAKLAQRPKPYWFPISRGLALGYRRNEGAGSWSVRSADGKGGNWIKSISIADDAEDSDGKNILTFSEACDRAKALARGQEADAGRPATVDEALADYANDVAVRGGRSTNASQPRHHMTPSLLAMPVAMLRVKELRSWRNSLAAKMPASTVNRTCKSVKACFNLAASHDERITNRSAWTVGLAAIPEADDTESNLVLTDQQVSAVVAAACAISPEFGLYVEVHAATGARSGQIAELNVGDLETGAAPQLRMPSSLKGKGRRTRTRKPMPISASLAAKLKQAAARRAASEPLLLRNGGRWDSLAHRRPFIAAAKAAGLPSHATLYALRHSLITKLLLAGVPARLVASSLDTGIAMLEKTYSKNISNHGDDLMRRALLGVGAPARSNVVAMKKRA